MILTEEHIGVLMRAEVSELEARARYLRHAIKTYDPPCGNWTDGHSYLTCTLPRNHEGSCDSNA